MIGTGEQHSVREFVEQAFSYVGLDWKKHVKTDPRYFRPTEAEDLVANSSKAEKTLGWKPKVRFKELIKIMVDADMRKAGITPIGEGDEILRKRILDRWWKGD